MINPLDGDIDAWNCKLSLTTSIYGSVNGDEDGDGILNIDPEFNPNNYGWYQLVIPGEYEIIVTDANGCDSGMDDDRNYRSCCIRKF